MSFAKCSCGEYAQVFNGKLDEHRTTKACLGSGKIGFGVSVVENKIFCPYCSSRTELREGGITADHGVLEKCRK